MLSQGAPVAPTWDAHRVLAAPLPTQLPASAPGKTLESGPCAWETQK